MPRSNLLVLECDFCGFKDSLDQTDQKVLIAKAHKWRQVSNADDSTADQFGRPVDPSRWYDSISCIVKGEQRLDERFALTDKTNGKLAQMPLPPEAALPPIAEIVKRDS